MVRGYVGRKLRGGARRTRRYTRILGRIGNRLAMKSRRFAYVKSKGFMKLYRKLPEMYITNDVTPGSAAFIDPTGSCIQLGTPIAETALGMNTYTVPFSLKFNLKQLINFQDVTNLCDAYKIKYVSIKLTYTSTAASVSSTAIMPNITWIQDHDDANPPANGSEIREKMGCKFKTFGFNKLLKIGVQPRCADTIGPASSPAYAVAKPMWINSAYPLVDHFAIKGILANVNLDALANTSTAFKLDITTLVYGKDFQ